MKGLTVRSSRSNRSVFSLSAALVAMALILAVPTSAVAQQITPPDDQYERGIIGTADSGGPSDPVEVDSAGTLPFTGLDLVAIVAIGVGLVGTGFMIRQVSKSGPTKA